MSLVDGKSGSCLDQPRPVNGTPQRLPVAQVAQVYGGHGSNVKNGDFTLVLVVEEVPSGNLT